MAEDGRGFGRRLADCRRLAGLSQQELAERSGLSVRTIGNLEQGRARWPHPDTVRRLADALELRGGARDEFMAGIAPRPARGAAVAVVATGAQACCASGSGTPVPRQLPPRVRDFTGRKAELGFLASLLDAPGAPEGGGTVVISAIGGTAGVGKTTLALHWAHEAVGRFPDGQLYVNLRGFDPSGAPITPAEAVRGFLDALGVPPERIPPSADAQAGLYRSLLAERRMLIVLDNARDERQVRLLLPASPASMVIITSRNQLAGLAAADGARLLRLDALAHDEAVQLLTARIGASRAASEPAAVAEIARLCAHLPLALAVAAAQACARPGIPLTALADELRDAAGRLEVLDAGDPAVSVHAVLSWSYQQLSSDAASMFRLLGLHPGPDISVPAAASLAAVNESQARRLLRELARDCLVTEHAPGRYAFHDLLRAYATRQAGDHDSAPNRDAAIGRILDHYLHTAAHAAFLLQPSREEIALAPPRRGAAPERPGDHRQALAWFEAEHQVLLAAVTLAIGLGADIAADDVHQVVIADAGHWLMEEQPKTTVAAIRAFLGGSAPLAQTRLTSAEVDALARTGAGAGTSGLTGVQTTVLSGDPGAPGPYAFEIRVPAHTRIAAHTHRDNRTAIVVSGEWHFGYGETANDAATRTLAPGGFYTEPAGQPHFAFTGDQPTVVYISGQGPTDTKYLKE